MNKEIGSRHSIYDLEKLKEKIDFTWSDKIGDVVSKYREMVKN